MCMNGRRLCQQLCPAMLKGFGSQPFQCDSLCDSAAGTHEVGLFTGRGEREHTDSTACMQHKPSMRM